MVDGFHTYFVAENTDVKPVWIHNDCYAELADSPGGMDRKTFGNLTVGWDKANYGSSTDSLTYHANKHWGGDVGCYLRSASRFTTRGAHKAPLNGAMRYEKTATLEILGTEEWCLMEKSIDQNAFREVAYCMICLSGYMLDID